MKRALIWLTWLLPVALLAVNASCSSTNCESTPDPLLSGTFITTFDHIGFENHDDALHATGTDKTVTVDLDANEVTIEYIDRDGRAVAETWAMGPIEVAYD